MTTIDQIRYLLFDLNNLEFVNQPADQALTEDPSRQLIVVQVMEGHPALSGSSYIPDEIFNVYRKGGLEKIKKRDINLSFTEGNVGIPVKDSTYKTVSRFIFKGTLVVGQPQSITFIAETAQGSEGSLRIYDSTNDTIICESSISANVPTLVTVSSLNNLPEGESIWEIQVRRTIGQGNSSTNIQSVNVIF